MARSPRMPKWHEMDELWAEITHNLTGISSAAPYVACGFLPRYVAMATDSGEISAKKMPRKSNRADKCLLCNGETE